MKPLTDAGEVKVKLEGLYRDRERLARELTAGEIEAKDLKSVEENITILEAQLRAKDAAAHHHHFSETETPEHD